MPFLRPCSLGCLGLKEASSLKDDLAVADQPFEGEMVVAFVDLAREEDVVVVVFGLT